MADIKALPTFKAAVDEDVVRVLEHALEKAKAGEIGGVAVAWVYHNGDAGNNYSKSDDMIRLLGSISILEYRILSNTPIKKTP